MSDNRYYVNADVGPDALVRAGERSSPGVLG